MIENDAVWAVPALEEMQEEARRTGKELKEVVGRRMTARARIMEMAKRDPLRFGYEPDIWLVARAMLGMERIPDVVRARLAERTGWSAETCWPRWRDELCARLGMPHALSELLIPGANRCAKTEFGAKLAHEVGLQGKRKIVIGSQKLEKSVEVQQGRVWHYLPEEWRRNAVSGGEYIKHSDKNGFTGNGFITAAGSRFGFVFYTQKMTDVFEGEEGHLYWNDEEVGLDWLETERFRIASVRGKIVTTFTPISGYTPAVGDYQDGMRVVRWSQGYMLPRDGGTPAPWAAVGLLEREMRLYEREVREKRPVTVPAGRCEDCVRWVTEPWRDTAENAVAGRVWERVPRVALCRDDERGIVWFHGADNPYGNPLEVIAKAALNKNARDEIRTRVYGIALRQCGKRFAGFDRKVHVVNLAG